MEQSYRNHVVMKLIFIFIVAVSSLVVVDGVRRLPWTTTTTRRSLPVINDTNNNWALLTPSQHQQRQLQHEKLSALLRGGGSVRDDDYGGINNEESDDTIISSSAADDDDENENDEERYSRQVYTMGARAHGLIRSSTVYVDGPIRSGLMWESIKNLALSGVGKVILIIDDDEEYDGNQNYHCSDLDDLGMTYIRGAITELEDDMTSTSTSMSTSHLVKILVEFLRRLNPALKVSTVLKKDFLNDKEEENINSECLVGEEEEEEGEGEGILLCVDRPYKQQEEWNQYCRRRHPSSSLIKFVSVETAGVYGRIFCDFGSRHEVYDVDGETPLVIPLDRVEKLDNNNDNNSDGGNAGAATLLVKAVEGERHDVSKDDIIAFQGSDGSTLADVPYRVVKVLTPEKIHVEVISTTTDDENSNQNFLVTKDLIDIINAEATSFSRQKQVQEVSFQSLKETLAEATTLLHLDGASSRQIFTPCDFEKSFDNSRRKAVFNSFQALDCFVRKNSRMPRSSDWKTFSRMATQTTSDLDSGVVDDDNNDDDCDQMDEEWKRHCQNFLRTCPAKFVPLQAIFGAIASQECLKAASGLYNPIQQFLLYDCDEVLDELNENSNIYDKTTTGLSYILGSETVRRLQNQKLFVVGSGAIGCEILKNIAAMGAGTGESGNIVVTDMDTIEKSNLSRQLLFRDSDIGKFKSKAAEEAVHRMNPSVKVECHTSKVGDEEDPGPFDSKFWSNGVDVILNALDNMEARLFMDGQCVANKKSMVDAGTLGSKGNVQVVVPHQSESYGSSVDPPEAAIPVCTLKNFPYSISHTIQWGRDLFDGLYVRRPRQVNQYAEPFIDTGVKGLANKLDEDVGDDAALEAAKELSEDLLMLSEQGSSADRTLMQKMSIEWAIALGNELFHDTIQDLLLEHPIDKLDDDGDRFWSGSRKPPKALSFSLSRQGNAEDDMPKQEEEINNNMIDFVRSAARLRFETYIGIPSNPRDNLGLVTTDKAKEALVDATEKDKKSHKTKHKSTIQEELAPLNSVSTNGAAASFPSLSAAVFEKDDDSNDHITFITAASNLRAICYGIAPVDSMETRKVAGKIVPAMITTTAFVSALSCMELIKLTQGRPLNRHRNAFINLALPFFAFTSPLPAEEYPGVRGETHTLWDQITIKEGKKASQSGGLTLRRLLKRIQKKAFKEDPDAVQVASISIGPIMIYANFLHDGDEELLNKSIWTIIEEAVQSGEEFDEEFSRDESGDSTPSNSSVVGGSGSFIDLAVAVEDTETCEEVELPPVRLIRS
jgi:ubiquitin-activating enzyme E1